MRQTRDRSIGFREGMTGPGNTTVPDSLCSLADTPASPLEMLFVWDARPQSAV
jgi:hypothetical protein